MPKPATLALFAGVLLGAALLVAIPGRRGVAQPGNSVPNIGRYQIMQRN